MQLARFIMVGSVTSAVVALSLLFSFLLPVSLSLGAEVKKAGAEAKKAPALPAGKAGAAAKEEPAAEEGAEPAEEAEEPEEKTAEDKLDATLETELKYAEALTRLGLPDYAKTVLSRLNAAELGPRMEVIQVQGLIAMGKFEDVRKAIAAKPDQNGQGVWAMKLALADGYYAWGKYKEARVLYDAFFKAFPNDPPEALNKFYRDSAYKYSQMLLLMNDGPAAVQAFRYVLKAKLKKHVKRQILSEMSEEMVKLGERAEPADRKKIFTEVEKNLDEVMYGAANDLWFGKAMAMQAHMRVMEGDNDGALFLVESSYDQLKGLDGALRWEQEKTGVPLLRYSPLAQCRYLLGDMMLKEAEKIFPPKTDEEKKKIFSLLVGSKDDSGKERPGAYKHFQNIFYQYPSSTWAPGSGEKAKRAKKMLEELGARITDTVTPEQLAGVEREIFQEARSLFNQQQFKEAAEAYSRALAIFPETDTAIAALGELAKCYIEMSMVKDLDETEKNTLVMYTDMVIRYLAERFNKNPVHGVKAGDTVLRTAGRYDELGLKDRRNVMNDVFFKYFTKHPRAAGKLFEEGLEKFNANDFNGALSFFTQIQTNFPAGSQIYYPAYSRIAMCYNKKGEIIEEAKILTAMIKELEKESAPGHMLINAIYRLAFAYKALGGDYMRKGDADKKELGEKYVKVAIKKYTDLIALVEKPDNPYQKTADERENNQKILEGCYFYSGFCYSLLTKPEDKVKEYKQQALSMYAKVVADFPKSAFAPPALSQSGTLWTLLENPDKAREVLDTLKKKYPDSEEAKNVDFVLGMSLLELGRRVEAIKVFKEMFTNGGTKYTDAQICTAGNELFKAGEYEIALEAFNKVVASTTKGQLEELALLGQGKSMVEVGQYDTAAKALETVITKFGNSRSILQANLYLSRACSQLAAKEADVAKRQKLFNDAIIAMKRVKKFDASPEDWAKSSLGVADVFVLKVEAEKKFGTPESVKEVTLKAVVPFLSMIMSADPADAKVAPYVEDAYQRLVPLYLQVERWREAWDKCNDYLAQFERGKHLADIRKWKGDADTKMTLLGISKDAPKEEAKGALTDDEDLNADAPKKPGAKKGGAKPGAKPDEAAAEKPKADGAGEAAKTEATSEKPKVEAPAEAAKAEEKAVKADDKAGEEKK